MSVIGIICEYNPFHNGHMRQLQLARERAGEDGAVVCAMSGDFVQRGYPASYHRCARAEAAVRCGADLVVELPVQISLSSAEGFARGGVQILSQLCDALCFGSECADAALLTATAEALLSDRFPPALRQRLEEGLSFPAARQQALKDMGCDASALENPNDILAVEYCKAILSLGCEMKPYPIRRTGSYHAAEAESEAPSATSLRRLLEAGKGIDAFVPEAAAAVFAQASLHTLRAGESAMLYRLRTMTDEEFEALPYGSEGLWRKLMHAARSCRTLEDILTEVKSKRYTRSRLDRMVMCAFLGLSREALEEPIPYVRVLAFTDRGRALLARHRKSGFFRNAGEAVAHPQWALEQRCADLYALFAETGPEAPGRAGTDRVYYNK